MHMIWSKKDYIDGVKWKLDGHTHIQADILIFNRPKTYLESQAYKTETY